MQPVLLRQKWQTTRHSQNQPWSGASENVRHTKFFGAGPSPISIMRSFFAILKSGSLFCWRICIGTFGSPPRPQHRVPWKPNGKEKHRKWRVYALAFGPRCLISFSLEHKGQSSFSWLPQTTYCCLSYCLKMDKSNMKESCVIHAEKWISWSEPKIYFPWERHWFMWCLSSLWGKKEGEKRRPTGNEEKWAMGWDSDRKGGVDHPGWA